MEWVSYEIWDYHVCENVALWDVTPCGRTEGSGRKAEWRSRKVISTEQWLSWESNRVQKDLPLIAILFPMQTLRFVDPKEAGRAFFWKVVNFCYFDTTLYPEDYIISTVVCDKFSRVITIVHGTNSIKWRSSIISSLQTPIFIISYLYWRSSRSV